MLFESVSFESLLSACRHRARRGRCCLPVRFLATAGQVHVCGNGDCGQVSAARAQPRAQRWRTGPVVVDGRCLVSRLVVYGRASAASGCDASRWRLDARECILRTAPWQREGGRFYGEGRTSWRCGGRSAVALPQCLCWGLCLAERGCPRVRASLRSGDARYPGISSAACRVPFRCCPRTFGGFFAFFILHFCFQPSRIFFFLLFFFLPHDFLLFPASFRFGVLLYLCCFIIPDRLPVR